MTDQHATGLPESRVEFAAIGKGLETLARVYFSEGRSTTECEDTNRLLTVAYNSYEKHFVERAVRMGKTCGDLLGELLGAALQDHSLTIGQNNPAPNSYGTFADDLHNLAMVLPSDLAEWGNWLHAKALQIESAIAKATRNPAKEKP